MSGSDTTAATGAERAALLPFIAGEWQRAQRRITIDAQGVSMAPLIRPGDRLTLQLLPPQMLRAGEVFAFQREGAIVVHRLVTKRLTGGVWKYCEKGDGLTGWSWVPEGDVLGRVEEIQRGGRRLDLRRLPWRWVDPVGALGWSAWISGQERLQAAKLRRYGARPTPRLAATPAHGIARGMHGAYRLALRILQAGRWR